MKKATRKMTSVARTMSRLDKKLDKALARGRELVKRSREILANVRLACGESLVEVIA